MKDHNEHEDESIAIEKQKTLRLLLIIVATLILAIGGFYIVFKGTKEGGKGKVDVDLTKGKISLSLERPIVDQIDLNTSKTSGSNIRFTEGKIKDSDVVDQINKLASGGPTGFSGKNFINREAGFLLSVPNPDRWQVSYNSAGLFNPTVPVNTIYSREGAHLNIGVSPVFPGTNIQQYVTQSIQQMLQTGLIQQMPVVTYDFTSQTAFAVFTNPFTMGQSFQKVIINSNTHRVYIASANYNRALSSPPIIQDLISMISTFTLF